MKTIQRVQEIWSRYKIQGQIPLPVSLTFSLGSRVIGSDHWSYGVDTVFKGKSLDPDL